MLIVVNDGQIIDNTGLCSWLRSEDQGIDYWLESRHPQLFPGIDPGTVTYRWVDDTDPIALGIMASAGAATIADDGTIVPGPAVAITPQLLRSGPETIASTINQASIDPGAEVSFDFTVARGHTNGIAFLKGSYGSLMVNFGFHPEDMIAVGDASFGATGMALQSIIIADTLVRFTFKNNGGQAAPVSAVVKATVT